MFDFAEFIKLLRDYRDPLLLILAILTVASLLAVVNNIRKTVDDIKIEMDKSAGKFDGQLREMFGRQFNVFDAQIKKSVTDVSADLEKTVGHSSDAMGKRLEFMKLELTGIVNEAMGRAINSGQLKLYENDHLDNDATDAALRMNIIFNSKRNRKSQVSIDDLRSFKELRSEWTAAA